MAVRSQKRRRFDRLRIARFTASVRHSRAWLPLSLALFLASCATNPVTGKHELSLVSFEREIQIALTSSTT